MLECWESLGLPLGAVAQLDVLVLLKSADGTGKEKEGNKGDIYLSTYLSVYLSVLCNLFTMASVFDGAM